MKPAGLVGFRVVQAQTDLMIYAERDLSHVASAEVERLRQDLESYLAGHPRFAESFVPVPVDAAAPGIARGMAHAAELAGVGPMAAVAGTFAEAVGRALLPFSQNVIVENGGDVWISGCEDRTVAIWSGDDAVPSVGVALSAAGMPCAVATSSGTIGHSVSLGCACAATVIADDGALADAAASAVGNRVHGPGDVERALAAGIRMPGVRGVVVVVDGHIGARGEVTLVPIDLEAT